MAHIEIQRYVSILNLRTVAGAPRKRYACGLRTLLHAPGERLKRGRIQAVRRNASQLRPLLSSLRDGASDEATTRLTPLPSRTAEELARRLLARDAPAQDAPEAFAAATEQVCGRVSANLSRWFGIDGTNALFTRALVQAQADHPALANVRYSHQSAVCLERLAESARIHGANAAADGVAAIFTSLIELLSRLIGQDIAVRLVEQSVPADAPPDARATGKENQQ